jgi:hypothetical protein
MLLAALSGGVHVVFRAVGVRVCLRVVHVLVCVNSRQHPQQQGSCFDGGCSAEMLLAAL